ncbi:MAG: saccharopine dehydrogenase NADP-binding domain-containing protein [Halioglobus sp.]|nr:saccharopine dehydrogenase NADP-binding domain-containing protein [Halioglobus sp.]
MRQRQFDLILFGASGFTGQLVVEYLIDQYGVDGDLKWAIAGRNREKLEQVRSAWLPPEQCGQLPILSADTADPSSLERLCRQTRVLCSTVGPYAKTGTPVVAACVASGTHYCDLCGEVPWMAKVIASYQRAARASGARLIHACGFDAIPSDMGTWFLQRAMHERHGVSAGRVKARVGRIRSAPSGGTVASVLNLLQEAGRDRAVRRVLADPYALYPAGVEPGGDGADQRGARFDPDFHQWTSPFIMAGVNTRIVRRSNALLGFPWGEDFRYDEAVLNRSHYQAVRAAVATGAGMFALALGPTRTLARHFLPQPGAGPDRAEREAGFFEIFFRGIHRRDRTRDILVKVTGDMDPGYGSTAKMLGEAAVCLARGEHDVGGGFWTPASALGEKLLDRLIARAGLTFDVIG